MALAKLREFESLLCCPAQPDRAVAFRWQGDHVVEAAGAAGGDVFPVIGGQPVLVNFARSVLASPEKVRTPVVRRHTGWVRAAKRRMTNFFNTTTPQSRLRMTRLAGMLTNAASRPLLLIIGGGARGSGTEPLYDHPAIQILALDVYPSPNTQFIADAHQIPLIDGCVDGILVQAVLEHVLDPAQVVAEVFRVLKPGGLVYAETPFMQHVHEGAYDFTRFTELGHRWLFRNFETIDRGAHGGPGASLYWSARYFFRALTRSHLLGEILALPFSLACLGDYFADPRHSIDAANGVYFLGKKLQGAAVSVNSIVSEYLGAQQ